MNHMKNIFITAAFCLFAVSCDLPLIQNNLVNNEMEISFHGETSIWGLEVDGQVDRGYFYPEESAVYWAANLPKLEGQAAHYEIRGEFPVARFMSVQGYTQSGSPLDGIYDYQITPDDGSTNPYIDGGSPPTCGQDGAYRVLLIPAAPPAGGGNTTSNTLYLPGNADSGTNYTVVYRIYSNALKPGEPVPAGYDSRQWEKQGQKPLPRVFYVVDDTSKPHYTSVGDLYGDIIENPPIKLAADAINALGLLIAPYIAEIENGIGKLANNPSDWFIGGDLLKGFSPLFENYPAVSDALDSVMALDANVFPNNATCYYAAFMNPNYGEVNVTRFRAPSFPDTDAGVAIDSRKQQVRFWSVCIHDPLLMYTTACKKDAELDIDPDGYVTVVFSREDKRPRDPRTRRPVTNWLPMESPNPLVFIRHMLPAPWFEESGYYYKQSVADPLLLNDYDAIAAWSGEYYPKSVYCSVRQFELNRCSRR